MDQQQREQLRSANNLRPLNPKEEGFGVDKLPGGVFGFSYAPATETPLFARRSYHSFEVHKLADGSSYVVGYVSKSDAEQLESGADEVDVTVYPDAFQEATTMVRVPFERIVNNLYKPIRYDGNALPLKLAAAQG